MTLGRLTEGRQIFNFIYCGFQLYIPSIYSNYIYWKLLKEPMLFSYCSEHAKLLLNTGFAYRCFCSEKRLDLLRKEAIRAREVIKYDNRCRALTSTDVEQKINEEQKFCIRFKVVLKNRLYSN